jgi:hypothetical protein
MSQTRAEGKRDDIIDRPIYYNATHLVNWKCQETEEGYIEA